MSFVVPPSRDGGMSLSSKDIMSRIVVSLNPVGPDPEQLDALLDQYSLTEGVTKQLSMSSASVDPIVSVCEDGVARSASVPGISWIVKLPHPSHAITAGQ